jgi:hypothetical protein
MSADASKKNIVWTLIVIQILSIGALIASFFLDWLEIDYLGTLIDRKSYYYLRNISVYDYDGNLIQSTKYSDADASSANLNCESSSIAAFALIIASIVLLTANSTLLFYYRNKNLFEKPCIFLFIGTWGIAFCAEIAGVAVFRGYSCLAQVVDNIKGEFSGNFLTYPVISEAEIGLIGVTVAVAWTLLCLIAYLVLFIKYRIKSRQQPHNGGEAEPLIR